MEGFLEDVMGHIEGELSAPHSIIGELSIPQVTLTNIGVKNIHNEEPESTTLTVTGLKGRPWAFMLRYTGTLTRAASLSYYYITDVVLRENQVRGNYWRMSTGAFYNDTYHYYFTYNEGTLQIMTTGNRRSAGGSFCEGTYELTYIY